MGAGWLGLPLAQKLHSDGHTIVATKRSEQAAAELSTARFTGLSFTLGDNLGQPYLSSLFSSELLILNIPPGRKSFIPDSYIAQMMDIIQQAHKRGVKRILFISTSAVYGERSRVVYEYSMPEPETLSAKAHLKLEQFCQSLFGDQACILRLSGLVGNNRHPVNSLSGKTELSKGQRAVNLIHQEDVIRAIEKIIEAEVFGHILHLSCTTHPSRKDYYQWAARQLELPEPGFVPLHDALDTGKHINADLSLEKLGLTLNFPSPYDMLLNKD